MGTYQIDKIWNEWEIEEILGEGASGKVYKAKRKDMEETYSAIKIIEIPQNDSEIREAKAEGMAEEEVKTYFKGFVDELVEEITLLESLKEAKGIVGISDYKVIEKEDSIGWTIYIRMELLKGINDYVEQNTFAEEDIINLGLDLSEALEYCEKLKIIHRDIKPENIFISKFGEYKLGDFGIARKLENTSSIMSKKGTYLYMPPEVYKGEEYDRTVDLYSLGLVMYKLGNENRTPFLPKAPNPITFRDKEKALMMRMQGEKILKPNNMSEELFKIIEKMTAYKSEERYQSAKELRKDLEKLKEKNTKSYSETVNIFTRTSTSDSTEEKTKMVEVQPEKIEPNMNVEQEISQNETIQTKVKESIKGKKKKIILDIIIVLLIVACIVAFILLRKNKNTEISNTIIMPNLINLTKEEADKELEGKELEVVYQDTYQEGAEKGKIVYQSIAADMEIDKGSKVVIFINNLEKDQVKKVIMPRVIDMNIQEATDKLFQMGLLVERIDENNETIAKDIVFEQDIPENTEIMQGSKVMLKVSLGTVEQDEKQQNQENSANEENNNSINSNWSNWLESLPTGINDSNSNIEAKTQYSYRTKQTTTSTNANLSGWTQNGIASTTYSDWGSNLRTEVKPTESDTLRIIASDPYTTTEYTYSHWEMRVRKPDGQETLRYDITKLQSCDEYEVLSATKHTITSEKEYGNFPEGYFYAPAGSKDGDSCPQCGARFWKYEGKKTVSKTSYLYQKRDIINVYNYYKWGEWSSYGDTAISGNDSREVRTRTLYRYKSK